MNTLHRHRWLACLALATLLLLAPGAALAQSPSSIAGRTIQLTISNGSFPFASSGSYRFLPSALDSSYAIVPVSGAVSASTGTHSYTKTGTTTATLSMTDSVAGSLTTACTFTTASSGTYVLTDDFGGSQSGTFTLYSAASPVSIAGYIVTVNITSGTSPFASSGSYRFLPSSSGDTYIIVGLSGGVVNSSGTYTYTQNSATTGYIAYNDSVVGSGFTAQLSCDTTTSGTVYLKKAGRTGYQTGTLSLIPPPPPPNVAPSITLQPQSQTVTVGGSVSFQVAASGFPAPSFQWRKSGANIGGATNAVLNLSVTNANQAGSYDVVVSNVAGSLSSTAVVLGINPLLSGAVVVWGAASSGQAGVPIAAQSRIVSISAGLGHTLALRENGVVVAWGGNTSAQTNVPIAGQSGVRAVAAGYNHSLALKLDGTVIAWGSNDSGQTAVPTGLTNVAAVAAGSLHSAALLSNGTVVAWGQFFSGSAFVPMFVPTGLSGASAIAAGQSHLVALKSDGTVVAWGNNGQGQTNVPVSAQTGAIAVAAGGQHTMVLKADGTVLAWGYNGDGQVSVPVGLDSVRAISAGLSHSMALRDNGTVIAWGRNDYGQSSVPIGLSGYELAAIAAGGSHSVALIGVLQPSSLLSPSWGRTNGFSLMASVQSNAGYRVQSSTNLVNWTDLTNFTATAASAQIRDAAATNMARRFYRVVSP